MRCPPLKWALMVGLVSEETLGNVSLFFYRMGWVVGPLRLIKKTKTGWGGQDVDLVCIYVHARLCRIRAQSQGVVQGSNLCKGLSFTHQYREKQTN